MKKIIKIFIISLGCLLIIGITAVSLMVGITMFNNTMQLVDNESTNNEKMYSYLEEVGFDLKKFTSNYNIEAIYIQSSTGNHLIPADYICHDGNRNKDTVILVHGLGGNRLSVYPVAAVFLKNGYNVLAYDQRSSGENKAPYTTFGYLESRDLNDCVAYLKSLNENIKIGLWGTSFGAATVGIFLGTETANENISFAVLDSPLSNMTYMLESELKNMEIGIPVDYMLLTGSIVTKIKLGFSYKDTDVCRHTVRTNVPVLIINSYADILTPHFMSEDIYNSIPHNKKYLFTVDDSRHAEILFDYPEEYEWNILSFIEQYNL